MSSFLDLRDRLRVLDFLHEQVTYLHEIEQAKVMEKLHAIDAGEGITTEELAELARKVGRKTWAARRALDGFLKTQTGCDEEWRLIAAAVSDSTAHLMERFRHGTKCVSLDETLAHEESSSAFRDTERTEIAEVRRHVHEHIWQTKHKELAAAAKKEEAVLQLIIERLDALRDLASDTPWIQDQVFPKIERFEDDLYFAGKFLDAKELDEEVKYYREEKELPAEG